MAKAAHITRRALFAAATVFPLLAATSTIAAPSGLEAWRNGFGVLAIEDPGVWPLMQEAHRQGFTPDQVTCVTLSASPVGPALSLLDDNGEKVRIYPDGTLRLHVRNGEEIF